MVLMLLASSRVKELTLIFSADRLLAAPLPLPVGGNPLKLDPDMPGIAAAAAAAPAAALEGPGPAAKPAGPLPLLDKALPDSICFAGLLLPPGPAGMLGELADCCCRCCCWGEDC
jgi:hypothetical protein